MITDPSGGGIGVDDDIEWDPPAVETPLLSYLFGRSGSLWAIRMPAGTTSLLVPTPPSTTTLAEVTREQDQIYGVVNQCEGSPETPHVCSRGTRSRTLTITVR